MSVCISRRGEYSSHVLDADYVCTYCGVLDEDGLIAALNRLRGELAEAHRTIRSINDQREMTDDA